MGIDTAPEPVSLPRTPDPAPDLSLVAGPPLASEPDVGALTLGGFLREVTERFSDREAAVLHEGDRVIRWSYADLWERAVEVARALRAVGVGRDTRVGVLMTNRPEWIAAVFGTALAGGVAATLSTFSTPSELDYLVQVSGVSVLLGERSVLKKDFAAILADLEPQLTTTDPGELRSRRFPFLRHVAMVGDTPPQQGIESWEAFLARGASEPRELIEATRATTNPSDQAVLFFSSGSTSKPKGILSAHRGVCIQVWRMRRMYGFTADDNLRCWTANGFFWSGNFAMALGATLASGGSLVLQRTFNAEEALELMQRERVNYPVSWPHQWAQLAGAPNWDRVDLSSLRFIDDSSPLAHHPTVSTTWYEPNKAYGNTETFTISSCYPANTPPEVHKSSSGLPLPGMVFKIVDPLTGAIVPRGEHGEICVKGPTLMLGYLGTPLVDTLDADGFFHTGDGGHFDPEGRLYWTGRLTDIIKTGGANVSPREVDESVITYPGVKVAQTVGVPHETLGEVVVTCVVPHESTDIDPDALRTYLKDRLASYKVPRHILFFREDEVALTGSAKIKSADLRELAAKRLEAGTSTPQG